MIRGAGDVRFSIAGKDPAMRTSVVPPCGAAPAASRRRRRREPEGRLWQIHICDVHHCGAA